MMDNSLDKCILMCCQMDQLLEDDYKGAASCLKGDLYDAYKRLVIREKVVLEETIDLLKLFVPR